MEQPTPTHYYIELETTYSLKNSLQKDLATYLRTLHQRLIVAKGLETMKEVIIQVAAKKSAENKRCKPITLRFWEPEPNEFRLQGFEEVIFYLKPAYHEA